MSQHVRVVELYRLGDNVYSWALAAALRRALPATSVGIVASETARVLPWNMTEGIVTSLVPAPWLTKGWPRKPLEFFRAIYKGREVIRRAEDGTCFVCPRWGVIERLLLSGQNKGPVLRGAAPRLSARGAVQGQVAVHPYIVRNELLAAVFKMLGGSNTEPVKIDWPFLSGCKIYSPSRYILFCPGAGNSAREWPIERWIELGRRFSMLKGIRCICVMTREMVDSLENLNGLEIWVGNIEALARLIGGARAVIAVDSFIGHFASGIGIPVFTLFGPQDPQLWRPWGELNEYARSKNATRWVFDSRRIIESVGPRLMADLTIDLIWQHSSRWYDSLDGNEE